MNRLIEASEWSPYITLKTKGICPLSLASLEDMLLFQDVMRFFHYHILPHGGGFLDQPAPFCQAWDIIVSEMGKLQPKGGEK